MDVVEALLHYKNATKIFLPIFDFEKNISYLKKLITLRTYNENTASFNVFNMSVILLLNIGVFSSTMQEAI
jgi:hypothetical protein